MIQLRLLSRQHHNAQVITGFLMLARNNPEEYQIQIENCIPHKQDEVKWPPHIVEADYRGYRIAYDTSDGYFDGIESYVSRYDFYFKRSFSPEKNARILGKELEKRVYPLGFNYYVTYKDNPYNFINGKTWKHIVRQLLGRKNPDYFTPERFTRERRLSKGTVIFMTRLWAPDPELPRKINDERVYINNMRIEVLNRLKERLGDRFIGGCADDAFTRATAPEWILSPKLTRREIYLNTMQGCDIAIGSMGLHESIGWKTGEYVAAGKAIVNERFHYQVPGNFAEGRNFLPFDNADECVEAVEYLLEDPVRIEQMKACNREYYNEYLSPDRMIERTLNIVRRADI